MTHMCCDPRRNPKPKLCGSIICPCLRESVVTPGSLGVSMPVLHFEYSKHTEIKRKKEKRHVAA